MSLVKIEDSARVSGCSPSIFVMLLTENAEFFRLIVGKDPKMMFKLSCSCIAARDCFRNKALFLKELLPWDHPEVRIVPCGSKSIMLDDGNRACNIIKSFSHTVECASIGLDFFVKKLTDIHNESVEFFAQVRRENPDSTDFLIECFIDFNDKISVLKETGQYQQLMNKKMQSKLFLGGVIHSGGFIDLSSSNLGFMFTALYLRRRHENSLAVAVAYAKVVHLAMKLQESFGFVVLHAEHVTLLIESMKMHCTSDDFMLVSTSVIRFFNESGTLLTSDMDYEIIRIINKMLRLQPIDNRELLTNLVSILCAFNWMYPDKRSLFYELDMSFTLVLTLKQRKELELYEKVLTIFEGFFEGIYGLSLFRKHDLKGEDTSLIRELLGNAIELFPDNGAIRLSVEKLRKYVAE